MIEIFTTERIHLNMRPKNIRYVLLLLPAIIVLLDLVFFYLDDFLDEGRALLYLDAYNRGYLTWWFDSQRFWGNFELWTVIGLFTGTFSIYAFGTARATTSARKCTILPLLVILAAIVGLELVLGLTGFLSPAPYAIGNVLVMGWYPEYLPQHFPSLLIIASGAWLFIAKLWWIKEKRFFKPVSDGLAWVLLVIAACILHLTVISSWAADAVNDTRFVIPDMIGFGFVVVPLVAFSIATAERKAEVALKETEITKERVGFDARRFRNVMIYLSGVVGGIVVYVVVLALTFGLNFSIDVRSQFIPANMFTWVYTAAIAAITYFAAQVRDK
jgi:hypothetical protein